MNNEEFEVGLRGRLYLLVGALMPLSFSLASVARPLLAVAVGVQAGILAIIPLVSNIAQIFFRPIFGYLSDKHGRKIFISIAVLIYATGYIIYSIAESPLHIIIASFVIGIGIGCLWPALMALSAEIGSNARESLGSLLMLSFLGSLIGSVFSGFVAEVFGWRETYMLSALVALCAFLVAVMLKEPSMKREAPDIRSSLKLSYKIAARSVTRINSIGLKPILSTYLPVILLDLGLTQTIIGVFMAFDRLITSIMQKVSAKVSTKKLFRIPAINLLSLGALLLFITMASYHNLLLAISSYITYSVGAGLLPTSELAEATERAGRAKGSGAGGFGVALSFTRIIASSIATAGGSIEIASLSLVISALLASTLAFMFLSIIGVIKGS
ncbi:MAG: MFS transporter [Candidatus Njordarchaeales archaeon]